MQSFQPKPSLRWGLGAFTLVELLVVIAIISILMTAGSIGLSGMGGKGVTSGVATAESLFDEARTTAVGRNLRSCVLVAKSLTNNPTEDLRRILVAYEEVDLTGTPATNPKYGQAKNPDSPSPKWELSSRGAILPDQTFFSSEFSFKDHKNQSDKIDIITHAKFVTAKKAYEGEYYIYQFNTQGIIIDSTNANYRGGASFIIGSGARKPVKNALPKVTGSAKRDFGGFVIWRNGRTSVFRSPEQMGSGVKGISSGGTF
ncbi:MAG: type II secretion system protein [Luteolibacter sp.]|jgi:prepilin-type N-terminal cleavage/methylation domain-containing protein|nr:type II secretion system protein [Luteolibacter sp.]